MSINVSIIEDDLVFAKALQKLINAQNDMSCVSHYENGETAIKNIYSDNPDVLILDINLPGLSGINLIKEIKAVVPGVRIIMCTSFDDDNSIFESLKNGAEGYIVKNDEVERIILSIREVVNDGAPMSRSIAKKVIFHFHEMGDAEKSLATLSSRESELLNLLSQGQIYKEIADNMNITLNTVKKHAGNIYRKLHVGNKTEAINKLLSILFTGLLL